MHLQGLRQARHHSSTSSMIPVVEAGQGGQEVCGLGWLQNQAGRARCGAPPLPPGRRHCSGSRHRVPCGPLVPAHTIRLASYLPGQRLQVPPVLLLMHVAARNHPRVPQPQRHCVEQLRVVVPHDPQGPHDGV